MSEDLTGKYVLSIELTKQISSTIHIHRVGERGSSEEVAW